MVCFGTLAFGAALMILVVFAVDPYDSGRFGWLGIEGVHRRQSARRQREPRA